MLHVHRLSAEEELHYLYELHGEGNHAKLFEILIDAFNTLQQRAQMLLGLITLCLTITGFSGPQIAASGFFPKLFIAGGLTFVLLSAVLLLLGPLQLRWGTQNKADSIEHSLVAQIQRRNRRTKWYHAAALLLVIGLTGYVGSVLSYLLSR